VISRELSGLSVVSFPKAKKDGMVSEFSENADKKVKTVLLAELVVTVLCMFSFYIFGNIELAYPAVTLAAAVISFLRYRYRIVPQFGGTTGDLCGYFLCNCEFLILLANILASKIIEFF
jgi:adenosylcobinamide-GDP ribazoletransferase